MKETGKRSIAFMLALVIMLCMSACGADEPTEVPMDTRIVGKWYNELHPEYYVEFRNDGTWVNQDASSNGTWKTLQGGRFQIDGIANSPITSDILADEKGEYIIMDSIRLYLRYEDNDNDPSLEDQAPEPTEPEEPSVPECRSVDSIIHLSEGTAWIKYSEYGIEYDALVDMKGNTLYSINSDDTTCYPMNGGICCVDRMNKFKGSIEGSILINSEGTVWGDSDEGIFDIVCAYGDGLALVYKHDGGLTKDQHLYGVIDEKGNWLVEYTDLGISPQNAASAARIRDVFRYYGDGVFAFSRPTGIIGVGYSYLISSHTGGIYSLSGSNWGGIKYIENFNNGYMFCNASEDAKVVYCDDALNENAEAITFSRPVLLSTDGTYQYIDLDTDTYSYSNGYIITESDDHFEYTNCISKEKFQVKKYASSANVRIDGNYGYMIMEGADGNDYFAVFEVGGDICYEPVCFSLIGDSLFNSTSFRYYNGYVAFYDGDGINILDPEGNTLCSSLSGNNIYTMSDGLLLYGGGQNHIIDFEGNVLITKTEQ